MQITLIALSIIALAVLVIATFAALFAPARHR